MGENLDADLETFGRTALIAQIRRLRPLSARIATERS